METDALTWMESIATDGWVRWKWRVKMCMCVFGGALFLGPRLAEVTDDLCFVFLIEDEVVPPAPGAQAPCDGGVRERLGIQANVYRSLTNVKAVWAQFNLCCLALFPRFAAWSRVLAAGAAVSGLRGHSDVPVLPDAAVGSHCFQPAGERRQDQDGGAADPAVHLRRSQAGCRGDPEENEVSPAGWWAQQLIWVGAEEHFNLVGWRGHLCCGRKLKVHCLFFLWSF